MESPKSIPLLIEVLEKEADPNLKLRALYALEELEDDRAIPALSRVLATEENTNLRLRALYALEKIETHAVVHKKLQTFYISFGLIIINQSHLFC